MLRQAGREADRGRAAARSRTSPTPARSPPRSPRSTRPSASPAAPARAVYIVHLSSAAALDRCRRARAAGLPVYVETRPLYLHLTRERFAEPDAAKYVGAPPLREAADREALWAGLAAGDVDTLCSDHAPWTLDAKLDPALNAVTARQGVADLETLMPMLYSEGVARRAHLTRPVRGADLGERRPASSASTRARARSPSAPTPTSRCGTPGTAARSTARACNRFPAIRSTTAGRCKAGRGSSSAAASSCSPTARSRPAPATVNGFGAPQRPGLYPPAPGVPYRLASPRPAITHIPQVGAPAPVATPPSAVRCVLWRPRAA